MATMRHSMDRAMNSPVEERFYQMSAEGMEFLASGIS